MQNISQFLGHSADCNYVTGSTMFFFKKDQVINDVPDVGMTTFLLEADQKSGTLVKEVQVDTWSLRIHARVIIDRAHKIIYFKNLFYESYDLSEDEIKLGGFRYIKKATREYNMDPFLEDFFGSKWHMHFGFKANHQKRMMRRCVKRAKAMDPKGVLCAEMYEMIAAQDMGSGFKASTIADYKKHVALVTKYKMYVREDLVVSLAI